MARRRVGTSSVRKRTNANTTVVTRAARGVRRLSKGVVGQPGVPLLQPASNSYRNIRRLMKNDPSKGIQQPEARQAMLTSQAVVAQGVRVSGGAPAGGTTITSKDKTPGTGGVTRVRTAKLGPLKRRGNAT